MPRAGSEGGEVNLDRIFCSGLRCNRRETCGRWTGRLYELIKANPFLEGCKILIAQFADHDGKCDMYSPATLPEDVSSKAENCDREAENE